MLPTGITNFVWYSALVTCATTASLLMLLWVSRSSEEKLQVLNSQKKNHTSQISFLKKEVWYNLISQGVTLNNKNYSISKFHSLFQKSFCFWTFKFQKLYFQKKGLFLRIDDLYRGGWDVSWSDTFENQTRFSWGALHFSHLANFCSTCYWQGESILQVRQIDCFLASKIQLKFISHNMYLYTLHSFLFVPN